MKRLHPLEQVVAKRQCMGCSLCTLIQPSSQNEAAPLVTMRFDEKQDLFVPRVENWKEGDPEGEYACPGEKMDMVSLAEQRFGRLPTDPILGEVVALRAAYSSDEVERQRSASGGVVPAILDHLLSTRAIDAAYSLRSDTTPDATQGTVVRQSSDLISLHGSVYHPARLGTSLDALLKSDARFAFVGLPCEIAGLEMLKSKHQVLRERHIVSIGLFCGGINTFKGIDYYLEKFGFQLKDVEKIDYRYGSWPGRIRAKLKDGSEREVARITGNSRWNILRYVIAFQGYWMLPRCRICPDQISDFADIAVGDPHLPRFRAKGGKGFSAVITRTKRGEELVAQAVAAGRMCEELISRDEVIHSQGYTLDNRRHAKVYAKVGKFFGFQPPEMTTYPDLEATEASRHYRYAIVDMAKLRLPKNRFVRAFYLPWQVFEYLFITFAPSLIGKRLAKLLRNDTG